MIREAINELKKYTLGKKNTETVEINVLHLNRVIKALEQTSWIPVSEMLPKLYEKVLVTVNTEVSIGWREEDGWRIVDYISLEKYADSLIRGWMPLPEPYKAESEE